MASVLFISETYLKTNSSVPLNVDNQYLRPAISRAQDIEIQRILGSDLYEAIADGITNDNLTAAETTLLTQYIQPTIVEWATFHMIPHLAYRPENIGMVKKTSDISEPLALDELKFIRQNVKDMAQFYSERLKNYLRQNATSFAEYLNPSSDIDTINPDKSSQYDNGWYLPSLNKPSCDNGNCYE